MPEISRARLPGSGKIYDLKDAKAREDIAAIITSIHGGMSWVGISETRLYDGARTNPIYINDEPHFALAGNVAGYEDKEFIYNGSVWQEFGSTGSLGALAYKSEVSTSYTPEGTITKPIFQGKRAEMSATIVPHGKVIVEQAAGDPTYTPEGTVSTPQVQISPTYETITPYNGGRAPSCTLPVATMHVDGEKLIFGWTPGDFDPGQEGLPGEEVTVVTGIEEVRVTQPEFHGNGVRLSGTFVGQSTDVSIDYTPEGTITTPLFEGVETTLTSR